MANIEQIKEELLEAKTFGDVRAVIEAHQDFFDSPDKIMHRWCFAPTETILQETAEAIAAGGNEAVRAQAQLLLSPDADWDAPWQYFSEGGGLAEYISYQENEPHDLVQDMLGALVGY